MISPTSVNISTANTPYNITVSVQNDEEPEEDETVTITFTSSANVMPLERSITVIDTTSKAHTSKCAVVPCVACCCMCGCSSHSGNKKNSLPSSISSSYPRRRSPVTGCSSG